MLSHKGPDKARHYLDLLDNARCNGQWQEIPELTRKDFRSDLQALKNSFYVLAEIWGASGLIHTAQTERAVAEQSSRRTVTPSSSTSLSQSIPVLVNAIAQEKAFKEDAFQAQICLAWLYQTIGEGNHALSTLPTGLEQVSERLAQEGGLTARWTHVCIIKGAYIRGFLLENEGKTKEVVRFYESMLPYISDLPSTFANTAEHQLWTEKFLSHYCMMSYSHTTIHSRNPLYLLSPSATIPPASLLAPFRAYAKGWEGKNTAHTGRATPSSKVWKGYYHTISVLLKHNIVRPVFQSKSQQCAELKGVEATFEVILLKELNFPRADQVNIQIETWVSDVMANWRVMCGPNWREHDLAGGDKTSLGRGVLDILYRAATRTFHSTQVLRHLFTVHASLAEFHLASKAIDSYFEILLKGKARAEKSGEDELGLDDDYTAIATATAAIKMLCHYGRREDVAKSLNIARTVEGWLEKLHTNSSQKPVINADGVPKDPLEQSYLPRSSVYKALALGYHGWGVCQSCWARVTYESSSRSELQNKALANFKTALKPELGEEDNIEFLYSLAFVLAETRDSDAAIAAIKRALSSGTEDRNDSGVTVVDFALDLVENKPSDDADNRGLLLRSWHLLALLLSVRHDFATAVASCEAALDLYGSKSILYGHVTGLDISSLLLSEKKNIIEVKITQLALSEVINGPEDAVNASGELLGLYTKLFDYVQKPEPKIQEPSQSPPTSVNGTLRSLRGSVLGFPKSSTLRSRKTEPTGPEDITSSSSHSDKMGESEPKPPIISITGHDGHVSVNSNHHTHLQSRHESNKLQKKHSRRSMGSHRTGRVSSPSRPSTSAADSHHHPLDVNLAARSRQNDSSTTNGSGGLSYSDSKQYTSDEVGVAITHDLPSIPSTPAATSDQPNPLHNIPSTTQNMDHRNPNTYPVPPKPPPINGTKLPVVPSLTRLPEPHYSPTEQTRNALTLLTKIWLVIAGLYRRASMPTDAQGALSEATTHVQTIESDIISLEGGSAQDFSTPGYGGLKACGELWADVLSEQGALYVQMGDLEAANTAYETALGHWPDHVGATVGLCNLLLDEYSAPHPSTTNFSPQQPNDNMPPPLPPTLATLPLSHPSTTTFTTSKSNPTEPENLESLLPRLAARDRAYGLLSALTKSGAGWDNSEAWFALSRAYEASGMVGKAREALWWVVELEEGRAVREWGCVGL